MTSFVFFLFLFLFFNTPLIPFGNMVQILIKPSSAPVKKIFSLYLSISLIPSGCPLIISLKSPNQSQLNIKTFPSPEPHKI